MSNYESSTTTFTTVRMPTTAELVRDAIEQYVGDKSCAWVGSDQLLRMASTVGLDTTTTSGATISGPQRRALLASMPLAEAMVRTAEPALLASADHRLGEGRALAPPALSGSEKATDEGDSLLRKALERTAGRLRVDERRLASTASERALTSMGFAMERHDGERSTGLWATRGDQAMAVLVQDGGAMETDIVGCSGDSCAPLMEEFRRQLAAQGAEIEARRRDPHGDDRGGALIARAARAGGRQQMAQGLVGQFEVGVPVESTDTDRTDQPTPARLSNEQEVK